MKPSQLDHLRRIDAHLANLLEIAKKRTPGRYHKDSARGVMDEEGNPICYPIGSITSEHADATFIASCAGNAEAGWESTRAVLAAILGCNHCGDTGVTYGWRPTYADPDNINLAKEAEPCCEHARAILAAWPLELLATAEV